MVARRQHAAGKDVFLNEVGIASILVEGFRPDGYDLQAGLAAQLQALPELGEIERPIFFADSLEHFDRDDPVVEPGFITVILKTKFDAIAKTCLFDARFGIGELLPADRQPGDLAVQLAGCEFGKTAPTAADLQHVIPGPDAGRLGERAVFGILRRLQVVGAGGIRVRRNRSCSGRAIGL